MVGWWGTVLGFWVMQGRTKLTSEGEGGAMDADPPSFELWKMLNLPGQNPVDAFSTIEFDRMRLETQANKSLFNGQNLIPEPKN